MTFLNHKKNKRVSAAAAWVLLAVALACCLRGSPIEGAEPVPGGAPAGSTPSTPQAVTPAEIIPRSDQAIGRLQGIESQLAADKSIGQLEQAESRLREQVEGWWTDRAASLKGADSMFAINDAGRELRNFQEQIASLNADIEKRSRQISLLQGEVESILTLWQKTRALAIKTRMEKPIVQRVDRVLQEASRVKLLLQDRTTALLLLDNRLAATEKTAAEAAGRIEKARADMGSGLLVMDSLPLWEALWRGGDRATLVRQAQDSNDRVANRVKAFFVDYGDRLPYDGILFLAILASIYLIRRSAVVGLSGKEEFAYEHQLLTRPFAAALLLVLALALALYPRAAGEILRGVTFLAVIPVLRLIPVFISTRWRRATYQLAGLALIEYFRVVFLRASLFDRLFLLALDCIALACVTLFIHRRRQDLLLLGRKGGFLLFALRAAGILLAASVIGNLVGNLTLASFFTTTTVRIGYLGLALYILAELLGAVTTLALHTPVARLSLLVRDHGALIAARCRGFYQVVALAFWLGGIAFLFGFLGGLFSGGGDFLMRRWQVGAAEVSFEDVVTFALVLLGALLFSRLLRFVLREEIFPRIRLPRGVPGAVDMLSNYAILLCGFLLALAAAGVNFSQVTLVISALGVGLGFGLQNMVSNFVSGLVLAFERPIQVGDTVEFGTRLGKVRRIGFRASVVRTFDGAEVIIPNSELVWAQVTNWSLSDQIRRIDITVGAAYGTDPNHVLEVLLGVARKHSGVLSYPAPEALFEEFGDSSLNFKLRCWTQLDDFLRVRSELTVGVNNAFKAEGITIPFPQRDLHFAWPGMPQADGEPTGVKKLPLPKTGEPDAKKSSTS